ncbi:hypothetical protein RYX36_022433, partial [Vicia faba]
NVHIQIRHSDPKRRRIIAELHHLKSNRNHGELARARSSMVPLRNAIASLYSDRISSPRFGVLDLQIVD